jgi:hypothetical protein
MRFFIIWKMIFILTVIQLHLTSLYTAHTLLVFFLQVSVVVYVGVLLVVIGVHGVEGARILGLFPLPSHSHFAVPSALLKELANRGHQVTVYSPFPEKSQTPNYTNIDTRATRDDFLRHTSKLTVVNSFVSGLSSILCDLQ